jgi:hypothetical protein
MSSIVPPPSPPANSFEIGTAVIKTTTFWWFDELFKFRGGGARERELIKEFKEFLICAVNAS